MAAKLDKDVVLAEGQLAWPSCSNRLAYVKE